ncbi:MAG: dienelactone hydrolase family protein [Chloroflexi bacterium]|nr:dienelactone hydrolase family protein [Chloroflexota bacterium]
MINPRLHRYVDRLNPTQDYLVREFVDNYEDGMMPRRDLLERVFRITGSTAATAGTLLALGVKPALADPLASATFQAQPPSGPQSPLSVPEDDPSIIAGPVTFPSGGAEIQAYWARPRAAGRFPAVLICHENMGTGEHYRDVTRRFAKNGYVGLHVDLLSREGGTDAVPPNERGALLSGMERIDQFVADFRAGTVFLRRQPFVIADRIGMTGYCFGGGITWNVAIKEPTLRAAVPYYGTPAYPDEIGNIRAAVLGVYGETDQRVNASIPNVEQQLTAAGRTFTINVYPGAGHAFFNDTRPAYHEAAALSAWRDTLEWFGTYLRGVGLPATGDTESAGDCDEPTESEE